MIAGHMTDKIQEESDWGEENEDEHDRDFDDLDGNEEHREKDVAKHLPHESTTAAQSPHAVAAKKKRGKRKSWEESGSENDEVFLSSSQRLTKNGGYQHTKASRSAISRANKGKNPWNKGRNRSESDKAKIGAGVRARNHALLLERLKKWGLTEEQWKVKKKEIKYVRERVRRAKRDNENLADNIAKQRTRYAAIRARGKADQSDDDSYDEVLEEVIEEVEETASEGDHGRDEIDNDNSFDLEFGRDETLQNLQLLSVSAGDSARTTGNLGHQALPGLFTRDIVWTPHVYDAGPNQINYDEHCPKGGPGGLICCADCSSKYSNYLTQTVFDIEEQKLSKGGYEIRELLRFAKDTQTTLQETSAAARRKRPMKKPKDAASLLQPDHGAKTLVRNVNEQIKFEDVTEMAEI